MHLVTNSNSEGRVETGACGKSVLKVPHGGGETTNTLRSVRRETEYHPISQSEWLQLWGK